MEPSCPGCQWPLPTVLPPVCGRCRLPLVGERAQELFHVDGQLRTLAAQMEPLRRQRMMLLDELYRTAPQAAAPPRELDARGIRNLLLVLGVGMLGIAALVFTVVSWGHLGLPAKATILTSMAALALYLPWPLARRGLTATAEAVAAVGLLLLILECYAAYSYGLFDAVDASWYAAFSALVVAVGWSVYAYYAPLKLPRYTAVLAAQLPLPLLANAHLAAVTEFATAFLANSALTLLFLFSLDRGRRDEALPLRGLATAAGAFNLVASLALAAGKGFDTLYDYNEPLFSCTVLLVILLPIALVAVGWRFASGPSFNLIVGPAVILSVAFPLAAALPVGWRVAAFTLAAVLPFLLPRVARSHESFFFLVLSATGFLIASGGWALIDAAPLLTGTLDAAVDAQTPVIFLLLTLPFLALRFLPGVLATLALAVASLPSVWDLSLTWSLTLQLIFTALLILFAAVVWTGLGEVTVALGAAGMAALWTLDGAGVTVASLLFLLLTGAAIVGHSDEARVGFGVASVLCSGWLTWAVVETTGWDLPPETYTLPVSAGGLLLGWVWRAQLVSSWQAYAPGLLITLLPSLALVWEDDGWRRPLLLGFAALAVCIAGVWREQQASALIGGTVLLLDAGHELTPFLERAVQLLPQWVPIAVAGAVLLGLGATYERQLRQARRVQTRIAAMW